MTDRTAQTPLAAAPAPAQVGLAAVWMLGAIASFSAMAIAGRAASLELDTFELMTYRSAVGFVIVVTVGLLTGRIRQVTTRHMGRHVLRNIAHFTGQNLWFYAITVSPLALVFALEFTSPLWTIGLAALFLGERLTRIKLLAGAMGFAGILAIVQPGTAAISPGMIAAASAAIMFATTAIFTKRLTATETITCILFWLTLIQLGLGLVTSLYDGDMTLPSLAMLPWVVIIGVAGLAAHFCLTTALSLAPASVVMPMDFARLPVIAVIGVLFYNEALSLGVILGAILILTGNFLNIRAGRRAG
ncbi:DMT family transporter [Maritalea mobilis]|uniref:DMT family transporter n=1 Tax=Maritalea mobilis TaxID=483324 RepID=UPI0027DF6D0E|nr:DMT family transporter [Maritalea mobilis]